MKNILLLQGDLDSTEQIHEGLSGRGYRVEVAVDYQTGLSLAERGSFDLVVLDVKWPGTESWQITAALKTRQPQPIIIVSDLNEVDDRVRGLTLGADDYVTKPFAMVELLARIDCVLRRGPARYTPRLNAAGLNLDPSRRYVSRAGRRIRLSIRQYALLAYLMGRAGDVCLRAEIVTTVWPRGREGLSNNLDVAIRRLREKIDDPYRQKLIHSVRGIGYVLESREPRAPSKPK